MHKKRENKKNLYLIRALIGGLVSSIAIALIVTIMLDATLKQTIQIKNIDDIESIEQYLIKDNINADLEQLQKIDRFILLKGKDKNNKNDMIVILRNSPLNFKNYYKIEAAIEVGTGVISQEWYTRLYNYTIHYDNKNEIFTVEKRGVNWGDLLPNLMLYLVYWYVFTRKFYNKQIAKHTKISKENDSLSY